MSAHAVYTLLARLAKRAHVADFTPHDLRRSFVSGLLDAAADVGVVQRLSLHAGTRFCTGRVLQRSAPQEHGCAIAFRIACSQNSHEPRGSQPREEGEGAHMPRVLSASTLTGNEVVNSTGESLGKIEDVMLDTREGKVSYAVLSFGGFMGMGDKLFAIPWQKLQLDEREERFLLDVPRETLEQAPGFDKDNWPDFADPSVGTGIDTYYGTGPR